MKRKHDRENSRKQLAEGGKQHKKSCKRIQVDLKIIEDNDNL